MYNRDYFAHDTKSPPTQTWVQRINAGGYSGSIGENIATSSSGTAAFLQDFLMVDWYFDNGVPTGVAHRGHRVNLLDVDSAGSPFREIGIGYHLGASQRPSGFKDFLTEDFGRNGNGPFILGVVYNDNGNNFYDLGEGMSGVTVRLNPPGAFHAVTGTAGGYAFPYSGGGSITVEATGGPFGTAVATKVVALTGENIKVDFKPSDVSDTDGDGLTDAWETAHFGNLAQTASGDPDGDTFTNLQEMKAGTDPTDSGSIPSSGDDGGGGGGCGLTGLEPVLLLGLLRLLRRR
jgi:hypothetical protein